MCVWFFLLSGFTMNCLFWNVSGAGARTFLSIIRDLVSPHHLHLLFLMKTRVSGDRADVIIKKLGFLICIRFMPLASLAICGYFGMAAQ